MLKAIHLLFVFIACIYLPIDCDPLPIDCGHSLNKTLVEWRIVGGRDAAIGEFPWFSLLHIPEGNPKHPEAFGICGSSIISDRWILTAAHCLPPTNRTGIKIRLAVHNMTEHEKSEIDVYPEKVIQHESWNKPPLMNDIALLKLNKSLDFKTHKQLTPICLTKNTTKLTNKCVTYGFGMVTSSSTLPAKDGILKKLDTSLANPAECKKVVGNFFNETTTVCMMSGLKGNHSVCVGDSGGPIQCQGDDSRWYQVGVVSYGSGECGAPKEVDVFTKVSAYIDWIEKTIANN